MGSNRQAIWPGAYNCDIRPIRHRNQTFSTETDEWRCMCVVPTTDGPFMGHGMRQWTADSNHVEPCHHPAAFEPMPGSCLMDVDGDAHHAAADR
jgi:hypothetical protein